MGGTFSTPAVFTVAGGPPVTISGIFDDSYYDSSLGENALEGSQVRITVQLAAVTAGIVRGIPVQINGVTYSVLEVQPDLGTGICVITLSHEPNNPEAD